MLTVQANNERDTERLGAVLADVLPPGTVVGLVGTLGAGKTRLVQAVATALGVLPGNVTSPTFVLVNEYRGGRTPIFHFDTYRLKDEGEFLALGPEEYFESSGLTFIEWSNRVARLLPKERVDITIEVIDETTRRITINAASQQVENAISARLFACGLAQRATSSSALPEP